MPVSRGTALVDAALAELGVKRMVLAIHDVSFPADAEEDVGRGSPYTAAARRFLAFVRGLGFTGLQLGPQGQTSGDNPSPYDGTFFSRNVVSVPLAMFAPGGAYGGLVPEAELAAAVATTTERADHRHAHDALHRITKRAFEAISPELETRLDAFIAANEEWLLRDGLYDALRESFGDKGFRDWPEHGDVEFWRASSAPRRALLIAKHARHLRRYAFQQMVAADAHAQFRVDAAQNGLALYGDLQVGTSDADAWARAAWFLRGYVMGAPPSRTNPEGQPWGYGVIDPAREELDGSPSFFHARIEKAFADYDSLRIDHPHGLVCPWVYRAGATDPHEAVRAGARLHESPNLPDHPELAAYAIARAEQINFAAPRFADEWVLSLDSAQIDRYARHFDALIAAARGHGRSPEDLACEVLSTEPHPLQSVLERHNLGRFRVTQKANLDVPTDGYRSENAERLDWAMIGNHDTPPIYALTHQWPLDRREKWAAYLAPHLHTNVSTEPNALAQAMLADLFVSKAENISIFFGDLFGLKETFNLPGSVGPENWSLRLPSHFDAFYMERVAEGAALNIALALATALEATGTARALDLASQLRSE